MVEAKTLQTAQKKLAKWYMTQPGRALFIAEKNKVDTLLANFFGYYAVQAGTPIMPGFLENSRIPHKINLLLTKDGADKNKMAIHCAQHQLPIASNSIDLVVLPHLLEYIKTPYQLLQETKRILVEGGHGIIIGFNPWRPPGLWRTALLQGKAPPQCERFISLTRLKYWLVLLGLELVELQPVFFQSQLLERPLQQKKKMILTGGFRRYFWPVFAATYIILTKKTSVPLTPIRLHWRRQPDVIAPSVIRPSPRKKYG